MQGQTGDDDADFACSNRKWSAKVPDVKLGLRDSGACAFYCDRRQIDPDYAKTRFDKDCCLFTNAATKFEDWGSPGMVAKQVRASFPARDRQTRRGSRCLAPHVHPAARVDRRMGNGETSETWR